MLTRRVFWAIAIVAIVAALVFRSSVALDDSEQGGPPPRKVALITGGPGDYWQAAVAGAEAAAQARGIELEVYRPDAAENVEQQMQLLSVAGTSGVDAIAVSPIDADRQTELITRIASLKPVVTFDSDASSSARHGYVGTSNFSAGLVAGTLVKKAIPEGGKVAVLLANETKENLIDRLAGLRTRLEESPNPAESPIDPRFQLVGSFTDDGDNDVCRARIEGILVEHPNLACLVTLNARQGPVAIETLRRIERAGDVKLIAFDTPQATLQGVEDGDVFAAIAQDPFSYGYEAIGMIDSLCRGDRRFLPVVGRAAIHISVEPITAESLPAYRDRLASRTKPLDLAASDEEE